MRVLVAAALAALLIPTGVLAEELIVARPEGDSRPFEYLEGGSLTGLNIEIIDAAARGAGFTVRYLTYPWARALRALENGEVDALTFMAKRPDREAFAYYDDRNILFSLRKAIVKRADDAWSYEGDITRLFGKRIGIENGVFYGVAVEANRQRLEFEANPTMQSNLLMLEANRVDLVLVNLDIFMARYGGTEFARKFTVVQPLLEDTTAYLGFSRKRVDPATVERFSASMGSFKSTPAYAALLLKYGIR